MALLFLTGLCETASAQGITALIPVSQEFSSNVSGVEDTFSYALRPETNGAPMPEGSANGVYRWTMRGNAETELTIFGSQEGTYVYTIAQQVAHAQADYQYDRRVYRATLYVYRDSADRLSTSVVLQNEKGDKLSKAVFKNRYEKKSDPTPTPPKGGSGGNVKTGDENDMNLYMLLMAISALGLVLLLIWARRDANHRKGVQKNEK